MDFKAILTSLIARNDLDEADAAATMDAILAGQLNEAQIAAFLAAMATKGESGTELAGAARSMRRHAVRVQALGSTVVDTCGTGGDGGGSFNISTTSAFVVAGAGIAVAKHGNRSVSSRCGSADVLEALGVKIDAEPEVMEQALQEHGIAFLFAPRFHSAMKHAMPVRKALAVRTLFNMLGPLANPAGANCQVIGVFAPHLTELCAQALRLLGTRRAFVVHGHDGMDEISTCAPTRVSEVAANSVRTYDLSAADYFGDWDRAEDLAGGDPTHNAILLREVLSGKKGAKRNIVLINAAAAITVAGKAHDLAAGLKIAAESIDSGAAMSKLDQLIKASQS